MVIKVISICTCPPSSHPALEGVSQALRLFTDFSQALEGLAGSGGVASDLHGDHSTTAVVQESTSERKLRFQEVSAVLASPPPPPPYHCLLSHSVCGRSPHARESHLPLIACEPNCLTPSSQCCRATSPVPALCRCMRSSTSTQPPPSASS